MRSRLNSFFSSYFLVLVLAIAKAIVIAIARYPLDKFMEIKELMKVACQRIEGKAERVDPSLFHPPEDGSIKQIFTQEALVSPQRLPGPKPISEGYKLPFFLSGLPGGGGVGKPGGHYTPREYPGTQILN